MRLIMIALLMTFLTSCRSIQRTLVCNELQNHKINPVTLCDISIKFDRCRCRTFDVNSWNSLSEAENFPLSHCDGLAGFKVDEIAGEIRPKIKAMYRLKENLCQ